MSSYAQSAREVSGIEILFNEMELFDRDQGSTQTAIGRELTTQLISSAIEPRRFFVKMWDYELCICGFYRI